MSVLKGINVYDFAHDCISLKFFRLDVPQEILHLMILIMFSFDFSVDSVPSSRVVSSSAYVLFYELRNAKAVL